MPDNKMTNEYGDYINNDLDSLTVGQLGPTLLEDSQLISKLAAFNRERIPERVVEARGCGAYGEFVLDKSLKDLTIAKFLQTPWQRTPVFVRFSTFVLPSGSSEVVRDIRGMNIKFYTEEGNYDLLNIHIPVFYVKDAMKLPDLIHALKPSPVTNLIVPERTWTYFSNVPETVNAITYLYGKYGIPANYINMDGYSVCAYRWINQNGDVNYVKYHFVPQGGAKFLTKSEARKIQSNTSASATNNLYTQIYNKNYPKWDVYIQTLPENELDKFPFHPFDSTKEWREDVLPYQKIGTLTLNKIPDNFFNDSDQVAFDPGSFVNGIAASESKLLQGLLFAFPDANRYRLGINYPYLKVNMPLNGIHNYRQNGQMSIKNQKSEFNFYPNNDTSLPQVYNKDNYSQYRAFVKGIVISRYQNDYNDNYEQAGELYESYSDEEKEELVNNIYESLNGSPRDVVEKMIYYFYVANPNYGQKVASKFSMNLKNIILKYDKIFE